MIEEKAIKEVIDSHSFVELKGDIKDNNSYKTFLIDVQTEEGQPPLQWEVRIASFYPYKVDNSESIHFFNTSLIAYPHIMRSGFLCLHTPKVENPKEQFKIDILRLKEWVDKYYVRKEKDEHYEELVVAHNLIGDIYYNFLYTNTNKEFPKNDYGTVDLTMLVPGVHDGKRMDTFLANTFHSKISGEENVCQWGKGNKKQMRFEGIYCFLEQAPSLYDKFVLELYNDMSSLFSWSQMQFLYKRSLKKEEAQRIPLFCGYKIPNGEMRWQVAMLKANDFPIKSEKVKCGGRPIINYSYTKTLIDWASSYNCSYDYFFGRGCLPSSLAEKKILIIGIGAIGSMVAKTLARSGSKHLCLYDVDLKEPGNVCRSEYDFLSGISDKSYELSSILQSISPFVQCEISPKALDSWIKLTMDNDETKNAIQEILNKYDIIFDCSTDDSMMYVLDKLNFRAKLINISISNHANELVCAMGNNITETVKFIFTQIIKSDTLDMFYPTGCWSPTFKASYNDIAAKLQLALKHIIGMLTAIEPESNFYVSETQDGMLINRL
ncbi:ThiF family adenylyltransferase [Prevotella merdae]|uniref:ThiF family adenylyltransferase n=1 Tax=Prevotella merdae TaxID=2079531 RepID=UPI0035670678